MTKALTNPTDFIGNTISVGASVIFAKGKCGAHGELSKGIVDGFCDKTVRIKCPYVYTPKRWNNDRREWEQSGPTEVKYHTVYLYPDACVSIEFTAEGEDK